MDDQRSLEEQLLGDMSYVDPRKQNPAPAVDPRLAGATVPVLDDMSAAAPAAPKPQTRYQELTDEQVGILQQQRAAKGLPPYTDEEIAELKADFIERQRIAAQQQAMEAQAAAQQQAAAMLLEEPETYVAPEKKKAEERLPQVDASALLEEPAPEPARPVPTFNQDDIEAAKKQAAKRAVQSLNEAPQTDPKEARRQMEALRRQQQADLAQAGFPVAIAITVIGVLAGACMAIFASGAYADPDSVPGFFTIADKFYMFGGIALALLSLTIVLRVQQVKGLTSLLGGLSSLLMVIPGIVVLMQKRGTPSFPVTAVAYVIGVIGAIAVTFVISSSEKLSAYYAHKDMMYD